MKFLSLIRQYRYETIAVIDGAIIMMLEMIGARIVAPYLGTSTYVWTAIIGVILGALAVGYAYGGSLADKGADHKKLSIIITAAAGIMALCFVVQHPILSFLAQSDTDLRFQALVASLLLFAPPAVLMGMVSPYLAKLKLTSLSTAGASVGRLYAAGTTGSIIGTFAAGYWLIGWLGNDTLGWTLVYALIALSFLTYFRGLYWQRALLAVGVLVAMLVTPGLQYGSTSLLYDGDSSYARYQVLEASSSEGRFRYLAMDNKTIQSGINVDKPNELIFDYTKAFMETAKNYDTPNRILMIGGGTFTVPAALAAQFPSAQIDVVEIDPHLTLLAKQYFSFTERENIRIINQDGRVYLNHNSIAYDMIFMDAYAPNLPPFQLATQEMTEQLRENLTPQGVVVVNIATRGTHQSLYEASLLRTYQSSFSNVDWYLSGNSEFTPNTLIIASVDDAKHAKTVSTFTSRTIPFPDTEGIVLRDNFAPLEQIKGI